MGRELGAGEGPVPCGDGALGQGQFDVIAGLYVVIEVAAYDGGKSDIDAVAVENPCKRFCQNGFDAQCLQYAGGLLAGGAAAEVVRCHDEVAGLYIGGEIRIERLESVRSHFCDGGKEQILRGNDLVGIHVVIKLKYFAHGVPFLFFSGFRLIKKQMAALLML